MAAGRQGSRSLRFCPIKLVAFSAVFALFVLGQIKLIILQLQCEAEAEGDTSGNHANVLNMANVNVNNGGTTDKYAKRQAREETTSSISIHNIMDIHKPNRPPDGTFNQFPVYYQEFQKGFHSNSHCIGENFGSDAWKYRSCHFQNLCFDTQDKTFVLFDSPEQRQLEEALLSQKSNSNSTTSSLFWSASSKNTTVSVGGINPKWSEEQKSLEWYPTLRDVEDLKKEGIGGYYMLPTDKVLMPWHSLAGFNPGHLVWDDFLPIYTLLMMFDLASTKKDLVLIHYNLKVAMWASCQKQWTRCKSMWKKFLPLLGTQLDMTSTQNDAVLEIGTGGGGGNTQKMMSKYVCARDGAAGMGMLTDHGTKLHGWASTDYEYSHNVGRGGELYQFRNWMVDHLMIEENREEQGNISKRPYKIVFSNMSSDKTKRGIDFMHHSALLEKRLGTKYDLDIRGVQLSGMTVKEQVELTKDCAVFITMCGGGAVTSMFLPKGASLLVYFNEFNGTEGNDIPPRLDWDLLNNLGYLRVHWLPRPSSVFNANGDPATEQSVVDLEALVRLVDHELDIISHLNDRAIN